MPITRKGPGKGTKTTTKKATVKDAVNMVKNLFNTGAKTVGKAKGPGALAGVVSNKGGVRTTTSAKVTGSKKAGIESLKAKRKSGEMSRKEANAKIQALRGGKQPVKKQGIGTAYFPSAKYNTMTKAELAKFPAMDSATFMSKVEGGRVFTGKKGTYEWNPKADVKNTLRSESQKNPGARFTDFRYDPKTGSYSYRMDKKKGKQ
jgi:hypothetical protein